MYVMFLDESGDHSLEKIDPSYPVFCLCGCIVDFDYYNQVLEAKVNELKIKYFGTTDIILRSYDIRKQKGAFSVLIDSQKRQQFMDDIGALIGSTDFTIIAASIDKRVLSHKYVRPSDPYDLCFQFVAERLCMFLGRSNTPAILRMESRESHNDKVIAQDFDRFRTNGNRIIPASEVSSKLVDLSFNQKSQNVVGHQIADLCAYPIARYSLNPSSSNPSFEILKPKIHKSPKTGQFINFGLKVFP